MGTRFERKYFGIVGVLLLCAMATQTRAATITVTNTSDSGSGSLRQALADANDGDTINFAVTGTITLTSGGLVIDKNVAISGPGADQLSIDGNHAAFQFVFSTVPDKTVTISGLTITNGDGGIWNVEATLTVSNCVVSGNTDDGVANTSGPYTGGASLIIVNSIVSDNSGPGIHNSSHQVPPPRTTALDITLTCNSAGQWFDGSGANASLTISNSIVSDNSGPGVWNAAPSSATTTILNSTLTGNSSGTGWGGGGGINTSGFEGDSHVTVSNSTISDNSAFEVGGGIASDSSFLTIFNSTVSGNSAGTSGGGIFDGDFSYVTIANSTISGNSAGTTGGGIFNGYAGYMKIANSTLSGNSAGSGGGIYNDQQPNASTLLELSNTILNAGASGENIFNNGGTVTSHGYNLSSDDGGNLLNGPGDQINTDPLLGPLQDNGGPTLTHMLLPSSPAIDAGDPSFTPPPFRDQRGICFRRVFNGRIDIGSFETQPQPPPCPARPHPTPHPRPTPSR